MKKDTRPKPNRKIGTNASGGKVSFTKRNDGSTVSRGTSASGNKVKKITRADGSTVTKTSGSKGGRIVAKGADGSTKSIAKSGGKKVVRSSRADGTKAVRTTSRSGKSATAVKNATSGKISRTGTKGRLQKKKS